MCGGGVQGAGQGHPSPRESRAAAGVPGAGGLGEGPAGAGTQHQVLSPGSACAQGCHVNSRPVSGGAGPRAKETDPTLCSEPGPGRAPCPPSCWRGAAAARPGLGSLGDSGEGEGEGHLQPGPGARGLCPVSDRLAPLGSPPGPRLTNSPGLLAGPARRGCLGGLSPQGRPVWREQRVGGCSPGPPRGGPRPGCQAAAPAGPSRATGPHVPRNGQAERRGPPRLTLSPGGPSGPAFPWTRG